MSHFALCDSRVQLQVSQERYLESLSQIETELRYIRRHLLMLEEQLQHYEEERQRYSCVCFLSCVH